MHLAPDFPKAEITRNRHVLRTAARLEPPFARMREQIAHNQQGFEPEHHAAHGQGDESEQDPFGIDGLVSALGVDPHAGLVARELGFRCFQAELACNRGPREDSRLCSENGRLSGKWIAAHFALRRKSSSGHRAFSWSWGRVLVFDFAGEGEGACPQRFMSSCAAAK
jgi:hypothetical protein